jgi:hypothetical protein
MVNAGVRPLKMRFEGLGMNSMNPLLSHKVHSIAYGRPPRGQKMCSDGAKFWPNPISRGKNFGRGVSDVFSGVESESGTELAQEIVIETTDTPGDNLFLSKKKKID